MSAIGKVRADLDFVESEMMQKDVDIAELKALNDRRLQDVRNRDKRIDGLYDIRVTVSSMQRAQDYANWNGTMTHKAIKELAKHFEIIETGHKAYFKFAEEKLTQLQGGLEWAKNDMEICAWTCEVCDQVFPMKDTDMYDSVCRALGDSGVGDG